MVGWFGVGVGVAEGEGVVGMGEVWVGDGLERGGEFREGFGLGLVLDII